jgi:hypothetical protein
VVDADNAVAGHVHDVRLVQDGPVGAGFDAALRVQGLVVGRGAIAYRLGYGRTGSRGPWLVRVIANLGHRALFVPWHRIASIDEDRIVLNVSTAELEPVRPGPDLRGGRR